MTATQVNPSDDELRELFLDAAQYKKELDEKRAYPTVGQVIAVDPGYFILGVDPLTGRKAPKKITAKEFHALDKGDQFPGFGFKITVDQQQTNPDAKRPWAEQVVALSDIDYTVFANSIQAFNLGSVSMLDQDIARGIGMPYTVKNLIGKYVVFIPTKEKSTKYGEWKLIELWDGEGALAQAQAWYAKRKAEFTKRTPSADPTTLEGAMAEAGLGGTPAPRIDVDQKGWVPECEAAGWKLADWLKNYQMLREGAQKAADYAAFKKDFLAADVPVSVYLGLKNS